MLIALHGFIRKTQKSPVEDLALSKEDFESLCKDGILKPHARNLLVKPHLRFWNSKSSGSRTSGHVEIEGFLPASVLRLAGYTLQSKTRLSEDDEKRLVLEHIQESLIEFLRKTFPEVHLTVSPATTLR